MEMAWMNCLFLLVALGGCANYGNPNIYTYDWQPPSPPDPNARSFMGYDSAYEQSLIDRYVSTHGQQVQRFRAENGFVGD
jgi:hypothetical protein